MVKDDGTWSTRLDTSECDTQLSYTMTVFPETEEVVNVTFTDIRVGEVWVCSGQSNMQFTVSQVRLSALHILHALFKNKESYIGTYNLILSWI